MSGIVVVKESKFAGAHESPQKVHSFFLTNHRHAETLTRRKPAVCKKWDEEKERWQVEFATDKTWSTSCVSSAARRRIHAKAHIGLRKVEIRLGNETVFNFGEDV